MAALWPAWTNFYERRRGAVAEPDVAYVAGSDEPKHRLDLFLPHGRDPAAPVALFVHGGYWAAQDRRLLRPLSGLYSNVGLALAARGLATAVVGYRQHPRARTVADSLADLARALAWLRGRFGAVDLALVGHSAGAQLVASLALDPAPLRAAGVPPASLRAVVAMCGAYDLPATARALPGRHRRVLCGLFGAADPDDPALARTSPLSRVRPDAPPFLLVSGDRDDPGLVAQHRAMHTALLAAGARVGACSFPGRGHMGLVLEMGAARDEVSDLVAAFIRDPA